MKKKKKEIRGALPTEYGVRTSLHLYIHIEDRYKARTAWHLEKSHRSLVSGDYAKQSGWQHPLQFSKPSVIAQTSRKHRVYSGQASSLRNIGKMWCDIGAGIVILQGARHN